MFKSDKGIIGKGAEITMKIAVGADHGGFELKGHLMDFLKGMGHSVTDFGARDNSPSDYPEFGYKVAHAVSRDGYDRGVLICKTGIGISIVANKLTNVRAGVCQDLKSARLSREHNDLNVLVMGSEFVSLEKAKEISKVWLETDFSTEERHRRRVKQISEIEKKVLGEKA